MYLLISTYVNFSFGFHKQLLAITFKIPHARGQALVTWGTKSITALSWSQLVQGRWLARGELTHFNIPPHLGTDSAFTHIAMGEREEGMEGWSCTEQDCLHRGHEVLKQKRCQHQEGTLKEETHKPLPKPRSGPEELPHVEYI